MKTPPFSKKNIGMTSHFMKIISSPLILVFNFIPNISCLEHTDGGKMEIFRDLVVLHDPIRMNFTKSCSGKYGIFHFVANNATFEKKACHT
jgi:hypothetical protein